jgi:hypothetical protein
MQSPIALVFHALLVLESAEAPPVVDATAVDTQASPAGDVLGVEGDERDASRPSTAAPTDTDSDAASPADDVAREDGATTDEEAGAATNEAPVGLAIDDAAFDADLDHCVALMERGDAAQANACLDALQVANPGREREIARVRRLLDATPVVAPVGGEPGQLMLPAFLKPGRLEVSAVSGIYGVWAGVTAGLLLGFNSDQYLWNIDPSIVILTTGGAGVGLGLAGLAAGYAIADRLDVDQGHAWSYTAGMTWGTSYAISTLPMLYDLNAVPWWLTDEVNAGLPLLGGGIGAASAFGLALVVDPDIAEVSMMNTGGWTAGLTGLLLGLNTIMWSEQQSYQPTTMALSYVIGKSVGLGLGLAASQFIDYTWGETLLGDVGVVLGGLLFGSGAFAFVASPLSEPFLTALLGRKDDVLFSKLTLTFVSGAAVGGGVLGLLTTTAGLYAFHRVSGVNFVKEELPFGIQPMTMSVLVDRDGQLAPAMNLVSLVF